MEKKWILMIGIGIVGLIVILGLFAYIALSSFPPDCVAVVKLDGEIATSSSNGGLFGSGTIGSDDFSTLIEEAEGRSEVKAILLEINSPGGSVVGSREMYEALKSSKKPKVAYFREVAASGGYYVAMGTDYIVANPDTITGSIGVISTHQELSGLFEKLGINNTNIKTGLHKDMGSSSRPITDEEKQIIQTIIQEMYVEFKGVVTENRGSKLDMSQFGDMTDGRIVTGRQALKAGLVDQLGNKKDALDKAAEMGGLVGETKTCPIEMDKGFLYDLFNGIGSGVGRIISSASSPKSGWSFGYK
jgi:protease IV